LDVEVVTTASFLSSPAVAVVVSSKNLWSGFPFLFFQVRREINEPAIAHMNTSGRIMIEDISRLLVLSSTIAAVLVAL
jgi:hypothetical protein